jgi:Zn-dependent peptidase ImmA (M78 family)
MDIFDGKNLSEELIIAIAEFVQQVREEKIAAHHINELLKDEIIEILEENSIVIYYPLGKDEENNGFLAKDMPLTIDVNCDFVFLNTSKTLEKQTFAAAHELGHIWGLDIYLGKKGLAVDEAMKETVMNRFAAELLMPKTHFEEFYKREFEKRRAEGRVTDKGIIIGDFLLIVVALMNDFFVPYKAVVLRLSELHLITGQSLKILLPDPLPPDFQEYVEQIILEEGYDKLLQVNPKKWINEFPTLLNEAERKKTISAERIRQLRAAFNFPNPIEQPAASENRLIENGREI